MRHKQKLFKSLTPALLVASLLPWILGVSGCPNAFSEMADKNSDAALFYDAQTSIDAKDYSAALTTLGKATSAGLASRQGHVLRASAYAGRCGLDLIDLAFKFKNPSGTFFKQLLVAFQSIVTSSSQPGDCLSAEQEILAVAPAEMRSDDWVFLVFIEIAKMGTTLSVSADTDRDGLVDSGFNGCSTISDADIAQVGTGLVLTMNAITNSQIPLFATILASMNSVCTTLAGMPGGSASTCQKTTASSFTASELKVLHSMLLGNELGFSINGCSGATGSSVACACP